MPAIFASRREAIEVSCAQVVPEFPDARALVAPHLWSGFDTNHVSRHGERGRTQSSRFLELNQLAS
jgi:hypothetical protein